MTVDSKLCVQMPFLKQISITSLEKSLREYIQTDTKEPFDIKSVPLISVTESENNQLAPQKTEGILTSTVPKPAPVSREENYGEKLNALPGIQGLGPLFHSSEVVELTESETEYVVKCIKHCYAKHVVLQFDCLNTLSDQLLENVMVQLDLSEGYEKVKEIPCDKLPYNETGSAYIVLKFPDDLANTVGTFGAVLKFTVKDCDPNTGLPDSEEGKIKILYFLFCAY